MRLWVLATEAKAKKTRGPLPFLVVTIAFVAVLAVSCVAVARATTRSVEVAAWDRRVFLRTTAKTVGEALAEAGIVLGKGDSCVPGPDVALKSGMKVTVLRAEMAFVLRSGTVTPVMTSAGTVDAVLAEAGVVPGPDDIVVPGPEQAIPDSRTVRVVAVTYGEVTEEEETPFGSQRRDDPSLEAGLVRVYRQGAPGIDKVTYLVRYEDGVEVSRKETAREEVSAPSAEILLVGTLREVSRGGENIRFERAIEVLSTAYCPCAICCGPGATGLTRLGIPAKKGVIAVDPRVIPLGARVYVDGYGYAVAADTGSAIKGNRIDVCFDTHEEALAWGMRRLKVYILE